MKKVQVNEMTYGCSLNPFYFRAFLKWSSLLFFCSGFFVSIPFISGLSLNIGDCPMCKSSVLSQLGYCLFCGQKLDWSE